MGGLRIRLGAAPPPSPIALPISRQLVGVNGRPITAARTLAVARATTPLVGRAVTLALSGTFTEDFTAVASANPVDTNTWLAGGSTGGSWNNCRSINGSGLFGSANVTTTDDCLAVLKSSVQAMGNNQYVEAVIQRTTNYFPTGNNHEVEVLTRFNLSSGDAHGYECIFGLTPTQAYIAFVKWLGSLGSYQAIWDPGAGSITPLVTGDIVRVEISGNAAKVYINSVKVGPTGAANSGIGTGGSANDIDLTKLYLDNQSNLSVWSSGQPGHGFWPQSGATLTSYGFKSTTMGSLP